MSKPIILECGPDHRHELYVAVDRVREGTQNVSVSVAALKAMLADHDKLFRHHQHEIGGVL